MKSPRLRGRPRRTTVALSPSHSRLDRLDWRCRDMALALTSRVLRAEQSSRFRCAAVVYARSRRLCALRHLEPGIIRSASMRSKTVTIQRRLPPIRTHGDTPTTNSRGAPYHSRCRPGGLINDSQQTYMRTHVNSCPFKPRIACMTSVGASVLLGF